ncbi:MAG: NAD(+) diphosphatase [Desulfobacterales bacterium]|nr:NAD(+) diphosphatase [Desulfobacterales bacterium]
MFKPSFRPSASDQENALWFIIQGGCLLVKRNSRPAVIPQTRHISKYISEFRHTQFLGSLDGQPCFAAGPPPDFQPDDNLEFRGLRSLFGRIDENHLWVAGRANTLVRWRRHHSYCGKCGQKTTGKEDERARICTACGLVNYPRVSPAIIVAVTKGDQILLARSGRFPGGFFSVLAGFVEPGEGLETCVEREVFEETGITVKNIRYFGSQPWPFPDSLMVAFTAEYAGGEIKIDGKEIVAADWYTKDSLPDIPPGISIARQLIDWFVEK